MKLVILIFLSIVLSGCSAKYMVYSKSAELGNAEAQFRLGIMYDDGKGVGQDKRQAAYWYKRAALNGHQTAAFLLSNMYLNGVGVEKDLDRFVLWSLRSKLDAGLDIRLIAASEYWKERNFEKAAYWYKELAKRGDPNGQYRIGWMYLRGIGVEKNHYAARMWLRKAAEQGVTMSLELLDELKAEDF